MNDERLTRFTRLVDLSDRLHECKCNPIRDKATADTIDELVDIIRDLVDWLEDLTADMEEPEDEDAAN